MPAVVSVLLVCSAFLSSCTEFQQPKVEPFYAVTVPPPKQELRWSNGKAPKSLDPAKAIASPEADIVRAVFEGLTDLDSKSLREIAGVAERWDSSADRRTWTFYLRKDARWSNGDRVTANDFVASWKRAANQSGNGTNSYLFQNIVGFRPKDSEPDKPADFIPPVDGTKADEISPASSILPRSQLAAPSPARSQPSTAPPGVPKTTPVPQKIGVEAIDDTTLKVSLILPDKDFAKLVANPIFRPVRGVAENLDDIAASPAIITNGPFKITKSGDDGMTLQRSDTYWNRKAIALEQIRFVAAASAEIALNAYKKGEVDVVTNASFEPLALKLLAPYEDFRRSPHSALNFYEFNTEKPPFSDRRVREALTIALDRAKLTEGDLEGINQPAFSLFPLSERGKEDFAQDISRARQLLEKAGFADGKDFPQIRLVINRNDTQNRVARSVARMWKQYLNINTVITQKETAEIEETRKTRDFDLIRRGLVLPTNDELVNIESLLGSAVKTVPKAPAEIKPAEERIFFDDMPRNDAGGPNASADLPVEPPAVDKKEEPQILTEADAVFELQVIPLYFPTSYSLVKPYVRGFEMNGLDAPSVKEISIDNNWQPKSAR